MDKGGNFIGWLFVDGVNLSLSLVEQGLSKMHFTAERSNYARQIADAETNAKGTKLKVRLRSWTMTSVGLKFFSSYIPGWQPGLTRGAFHQAFCQCFSLTNFISYWNPCIWLAESKFVSEKHWQNAWWNAPQGNNHHHDICLVWPLGKNLVPPWTQPMKYLSSLGRQNLVSQKC